MGCWARSTLIVGFNTLDDNESQISLNTSNALSNGHKMCLESRWVSTRSTSVQRFFFSGNAEGLFPFASFLYSQKRWLECMFHLAWSQNLTLERLRVYSKLQTTRMNRVNNLNSQIRKWTDCCVYKNCKKSINDSVFSSWMEAKSFWTF